jgi:hypothetical protein
MHSTSPSTRSRNGLAAPRSSACAILPKTQRSPSSSIATMRIGGSSAGLCFADAPRSSLREVSTTMPRRYSGPVTRSSSRCGSRTIRSSPFASSARSAGGTCPRWFRHSFLGAAFAERRRIGPDESQRSIGRRGGTMRRRARPGVGRGPLPKSANSQNCRRQFLTDEAKSLHHRDN